ncbi:hypothetical protein KIN20_022356 [Parelaphostrongylus tenuis]|uniref:Uncharacterized protein n=1 Tax=Parelaphostrongylus tenuis TaxID=148309 RepID=A0AAD5MQH4_PARTN|nr:hypothetical protein KIN20_022356 [Parelaphostrongylus tenuis]
MTHIRTPEKNMNFNSESQSSTLKLASSHQSPKFSLINVNASAPHSPFKRNALIKERTESQLEVFDRISSKLDTSIQNMRDLLSRPISFGLRSVDASNMPAFTDSRQTIDISQLPKQLDKKY